MIQLELTEEETQHLVGALRMTIAKVDELISDGGLVFPGRNMAELFQDANDFASFQRSLEGILAKLPDD